MKTREIPTARLREILSNPPTVFEIGSTTAKAAQPSSPSAPPEDQSDSASPSVPSDFAKSNRAAAYKRLNKLNQVAHDKGSSSSSSSLSEFFQHPAGFRSAAVDTSKLFPTSQTAPGLATDLANLKKVSVTYSGYNPPPSERALLGDLLYLEIRTPSDGVVNVTSTPRGFYVNRTQSGKLFDPSPAAASHFSHDLLGLLLSKCSRFSITWKSALDGLRKREESERKQSPSQGSSTSVVYSTMKDLYGMSPLYAFPSFLSTKDQRPKEHEVNLNRCEDYVLSSFGIEEKGCVREWNEELQSSLEMPVDTFSARLFRARLIHRTLSEFASAAVSGVVAIHNGHVPPINPNESRDVHAYVFNNIFFSEPFDHKDTFKLCKGVAAVRKCANRDLMNTSIIQALEIPKLRILGSVIVDYMGKRFVAQGIAPGLIDGVEKHEGGRKCLVMGKVECNEPIIVDEELSKLLRDNISETFGVASRSVVNDLPGRGADADADADADANTDSTVEIVGPIEMKGILGNDKRKYVLEIPRLMPRDANWVAKAKGGTGLLEGKSGFPAKEGGSGKRDYVPKEIEDEEWTALVLRRELVDLHKVSLTDAARKTVVDDLKKELNNLDKSLTELVEEKVKEIKAGGGLGGGDGEDEKGKGKENGDLATAGDEDSKNAILQEFAKGKQAEYQKERTRLIEEASEREKSMLESVYEEVQSARYNVNVLYEEVKGSGEEWEKDEENARKLAKFLHDGALPRLTEYIQSRGLNVVPTDGEELTELIHSYGINCRYLGALASLAITTANSNGAANSSFNDQSGSLTKIPNPFAKYANVLSGCWLDLLEVEMVARAAKHVMDKKIRDCRAPVSFVLAGILSALVSVAEETVGESDTRESKNLGKDGSAVNYTALAMEDGAEDIVDYCEFWEDIRVEVGR